MARSEFRWHQNGNVFWADFRPNYRTQPPLPDPANTAPTLTEPLPPDRLAQIERRIDGVLLDILQGHQGILRALSDHDRKARQWNAIFSAVTTELRAVRQLLEAHEAGLVARGAGYARALTAIHERLESLEKKPAPSCSPSRQDVLTFSLRSIGRGRQEA